MSRDQNISPPQARIALRVGVTGHRLHKLPEVLVPLRKQLRGLLSSIRDTTLGLLDDPTIRDAYSTKPPLLRIVSPIAEGADRLVAEEGMACGFELQCPLPFHQEEYEKDFETPESRVEYRRLLAAATAIFELDGARDGGARQDAAYLAVGHMVLKHCDVLIAVWDGEGPGGKGGTGEIIANAVRLGMCTMWVHAQQPHEVRLITGKLQGGFVTRPLKDLDDAIRQVLTPPPSRRSRPSAARPRSGSWPKMPPTS